MSELLVVEGCTYSCTAGATATLTVGVTSPYVKCNVLGVPKKAYFSITVTVALTGYISMPATFVGASAKVKGNGTSFVMKDQTVEVTLTQSPPLSGTTPVTVSIANAGQSKVKIV